MDRSVQLTLFAILNVNIWQGIGMAMFLWDYIIVLCVFRAGENDCIIFSLQICINSNWLLSIIETNK